MRLFSEAMIILIFECVSGRYSIILMRLKNLIIAVIAAAAAAAAAVLSAVVVMVIKVIVAV